MGDEMSKEIPRISRRGLLRGSLAVAIGTLAGGMLSSSRERQSAPQAAPEKSPVPAVPTSEDRTQSPFAVGRPPGEGQPLPPERQIPGAAPTDTPTRAAETVVTRAPTRAAQAPPPNPTREPAPTREPEPELFAGVTLSSEFLERGPGRGGGGVSIDSGAQAETQTLTPIEYGNLAWRRELDPREAIDKLKILVAQGAFGGVDGSSFHFLNLDPGLKQGDTPFRLFRFTLDELPAGAVEINLGDKLVLKKRTHITTIGNFVDAQGVEKTAIVFTDDSEVATKQGVPDHYFALISTFSSRDGEVSLEGLVREDKELVFKREGASTRIGFQKGDGKLAEWEANRVTEELAEKFKEAMRKDLIPEPTVPKEEILQIETLETTWNPELKRWEYNDTQLFPGEYRRPEDDKVFVGWWNEQDKRFEVSPDLYVLRARWKGLYAPWSAVDAEKEFQKTVNVAAKQARIPIPVDFTQGEMLRGGTDVSGVAFFGFRQIPIGKVFYAPFPGKIEEATNQNVRSGEWTMYVFLKGSVVLKIEFKTKDDYLGGASTKVGERLIKFSDKIIPKAKALVPNPGDYQIRCLIASAPDAQSWGITFKDNVLLDEKGRFIYTGK